MLDLCQEQWGFYTKKVKTIWWFNKSSYLCIVKQQHSVMFRHFD